MRRPARQDSPHSKHDLPEDVPGLQALVCLRGVCELEFSSNRYLKLVPLDRLVETLERRCIIGGIVRDDGKAVARRGLRRYAARKCQAPAWPQRRDATIERIAAGERKHSIRTLGRESARRRRDVTLPSFDGGISPQPAHELDAVVSRSRREHSGSAQLSELNRERTDRTTGPRG